jgi:GT2 family glycosyltransferase
MSSTADAPSPLIVVPVYGKLDLAERAIRALDTHTDPQVDLLVVDDVGTERVDTAGVATWVGSSRRVDVLVHDTNRGFVGSANDGFERRAGRDVVIVTTDVVVFPGWLDGLREAVDGERVASATAATNNGSIATVPSAAHLTSWPDLEPVAATARAEGRPPVDIPVAVGHCVYVRDAALTDVGGFDQAFAPGYGEEVDWSLRAARRGWRHRLAPSVVVWHDGGQSFDRVPWRKRAHELVLLRRYPADVLKLRRYRSPLADDAS